MPLFFFVEEQIQRFRKSADGINDVSKRLAEMPDAVNFMRPSREGNGRTQREFVRTLALEKGYALNLNPPDDLAAYREYIRCSIEEDIAG